MRIVETPERHAPYQFVFPKGSQQRARRRSIGAGKPGEFGLEILKTEIDPKRCRVLGKKLAERLQAVGFRVPNLYHNLNMNPKASRRSFMNMSAGLGVAAGLGAAGALSLAPALTAAAGEEDLKLGVASYSFREFGRAMALSGTKKLGVKYINIKDFHLAINSTPEEIAKAKKDIEKAGLINLGCGNVSFQKADEADMREKFRYAKALGCPLIVCAPTHETLPMLEKFVKEFDIKIAVHNHGTEDKHFPTPQSVLEVVKNMDPRCGLCIDIGHTVRTGVDLIDTVALAGARLHDMHVKDLANLSERSSQVPVGDGKIPIPALFKQLKKMNYQGGVMLEYEIEAENPLPGMVKSFAYMRGVLAGLKA